MGKKAGAGLWGVRGCRGTGVVGEGEGRVGDSAGPEGLRLTCVPLVPGSSVSASSVSASSISGSSIAGSSIAGSSIAGSASPSLSPDAELSIQTAALRQDQPLLPGRLPLPSALPRTLCAWGGTGYAL